MPLYEISIIIRKMSRAGTATVLKRAATAVLKNNGILFAIENLGAKPLPYKISVHGHKHREGSYFLFKFGSPSRALTELADEYRRDLDIIRIGYTKLEKLPEFGCSLEEELKPPAYREDVKELIETGKKREIKWEPKTGLSYNPFTP